MHIRQQTGVTMIELMIVIVIAAILAGLAAPSFNRFINDTRQSSTMSQLTSDLNRARGEAIKRNRRVLVCARASDTACGNDWDNGWLVCHDSDTDDDCDAGTADIPNPIVVHPPLNEHLTLSGGGADFVRFNPNGTQGGAGAATVSFTLSGDWGGAQDSTTNIAVTGNISKP